MLLCIEIWNPYINYNGVLYILGSWVWGDVVQEVEQLSNNQWFPVEYLLQSVCLCEWVKLTFLVSAVKKQKTKISDVKVM